MASKKAADRSRSRTKGPKRGDGEWPKFQIRLPRELLDRFEKTLSRTGWSRNGAVNIAIEEYCDRIERSPKK